MCFGFFKNLDQGPDGVCARRALENITKVLFLILNRGLNSLRLSSLRRRSCDGPLVSYKFSEVQFNFSFTNSNQHRTNTTSMHEPEFEPGTSRTAVEHLPAAPRRSATIYMVHLFDENQSYVMTTHASVYYTHPSKVLQCSSSTQNFIFSNHSSHI